MATRRAAGTRTHTPHTQTHACMRVYTRKRSAHMPSKHTPHLCDACGVYLLPQVLQTRRGQRQCCTVLRHESCVAHVQLRAQLAPVGRVAHICEALALGVEVRLCWRHAHIIARVCDCCCCCYQQWWCLGALVPAAWLLHLLSGVCCACVLLLRPSHR